MDIIKFLDGFTTDKLTARMSSRRGALATLGIFGAQALMAAAPCFRTASGKEALKQSNTDVVNALQLALILEYLEAEFYIKALQSGVLPNGRPEAVYMQISKHETAHVEFLKAGLEGAGVEPVLKPEFDYTAGGAFAPFDTANDNAYLQLLTLAQAFEDTGVRAYKGQAGNLQGTPFLMPALRIHSVEARHAAEIRRLRAGFLDIPLNEDTLPWITLDNRGLGMPPITQPVYDGEEQVVQGGVNLVDITEFGPVEVSQSYDEPLATPEVIKIIAPFLGCKE
ncbi:ferritin-like domain-containing protein [Gillisia sp. JM1]|uniref:ferritin-like domain-containing protein n=1 Tax=Gillisia sp. JM1 TaxID=1283286 RepID=UPI0003F574B8|nr:ferritin-like domain-containing protein [Gillisia sp. JM1]